MTARNQENWGNDALQFPRLIDELLAADAVSGEVEERVCASMDITREELIELFRRATAAWDEIKAATGDTEDRRHLDALRQRATDIYGNNEVEVDPLWPADLSVADEGTWVRGWLWLDNEDEEDEDDDGDAEA